MKLATAARATRAPQSLPQAPTTWLRGLAARAALGLGLALAGCAQIDVDEDSAAPPAGLETYAWLEPALEPSSRAMSEELQARVRASIDSNLADLGYLWVPRGEADFLVTFDSEITLHEQNKDPFYAGVRVEQYEYGTLTIEWSDPRTRESLWRGSAGSNLRGVAASDGLLSPGTTPLAHEAERKWQIDRKVAAILGQVPARE